MNKYIYLIVGESGCGKTTIVNKLTKRYGLKSISSYTTRPRRCNDEQGHIFVSDKEFDQLQDIIGYTKFAGARYCATACQIEENDLYVIDVKGVQFFREYYKGHKKHKVIYINTPEDVRAARMAIRGDSNQQIIQRLNNDRIEFKDVLPLADVSIENNNIDECVEEVFYYICEQEGKAND